MEDQDRRSATKVTPDDAGDDDVRVEVIDDGDRRSTALRRRLSFAYNEPHHRNLDFTLWQSIVLGYQSLGVVYGDLGTSPLYVFSSVNLPGAGSDDFLGILSLILWTLTASALFKYVFVVLNADDHGEGGTFALYSLLRQHINFKSKMVVAPNARLRSDLQLRYHAGGAGSKGAGAMHQFLEGSSKAQAVITVVVLLGTCMLIGDGALTPAISVLSAVQGIQSQSSKITQGVVVGVSVVILLALFLCQRFGTGKISFSFSPIMLLWFSTTAAIGVYNIAVYYPPVLKAVSPHYIGVFFRRNGWKGWELLGAIVLCITGAEAMFADLGHFNKRGIQLAFSAVVYPSLILTYAGEAAYLIKNPQNLGTAFYSSVPPPVFWPMFIISTLAAIVASQALISASFSIIRQSMSMGCFPRVTMRHTSAHHEGQVYSPEINYFLMIVCVLIVVGFGGGPQIGNAFGVAVIWVMLLTTLLTAIVMVVIWEANVFLVALFVVFFVGVEGIYMTSLLNKVPDGGWVPFAISAFFLLITFTWTYGRSKKSEYEAAHAVVLPEFAALVERTPRTPGMCFFCVDLVSGVPPIVSRYVSHVSSLRQLTVFVTVRTLPVTTVLAEERLLVDKLGPAGAYRCLVQYGYMDSHEMAGDDYAASVLAALADIAEGREEKEMLAAALAGAGGEIFVLGRVVLKAGAQRNWFQRLAIDVLYRFLHKNFRSSVDTLRIPPGKTLQVGMLYEV